MPLAKAREGVAGTASLEKEGVGVDGLMWPSEGPDQTRLDSWSPLVVACFAGRAVAPACWCKRANTCVRKQGDSWEHLAHYRSNLSTADRQHQLAGVKSPLPAAALRCALGTGELPKFEIAGIGASSSRLSRWLVR